MKRVDVKTIPVEKYDLVAISDYNKGFLTEDDIASITKRHDTVFVDTKKPVGAWLSGAKFIKINNFEYERSKATITPVVEKKTIVTKGELGSIWNGKTYSVPKKVEVKDVSGAGDSFFAALVVRYAETGDIEEAIRFANECASEVVQHKGVTIIQRKYPTDNSKAKSIGKIKKKKTSAR